MKGLDRCLKHLISHRNPFCHQDLFAVRQDDMLDSYTACPLNLLAHIYAAAKFSNKIFGKIITSLNPIYAMSLVYGEHRQRKADKILTIETCSDEYDVHAYTL